MEAYHSVLFVSRNKDNKQLGSEYKQRSQSFLTTKKPGELKHAFKEFCDKGLSGEYSRFYMSVNTFNHSKVLLALQVYLLKYTDTDLSKIDSLLAKLAMKENCNETKRFLLDYDSREGIDTFLMKLAYTVGDENSVRTYDTPNGYAVVTGHGFDTRELLAEYGETVSLHRNGQLFIAGAVKERERT